MPNENPAKPATDSLTETLRVVVPQHLNGAGTLFGGQLALWIDEVGGVTAARHCRTAVTTAAIEHLQFHEPVYQNELLILRGRVTYTGRTSLEVRVDSFAENTKGERRLINTAFVIMVSLGPEGKPIPVPPLKLETEEDKREYEAARMRKTAQTQYTL